MRWPWVVVALVVALPVRVAGQGTTAPVTSLELGIGGGRFRVSCAGCDPDASMGIARRAGLFRRVSDHLQVGITVTGIESVRGGFLTREAGVLLGTRAYPLPTRGYHLIGGVGLGKYISRYRPSESEEFRFRLTGLTAEIGLGMDLRGKDRSRVTLQVVVRRHAEGDLQREGVTLVPASLTSIEVGGVLRWRVGGS